MSLGRLKFYVWILTLFTWEAYIFFAYKVFQKWSTFKVVKRTFVPDLVFKDHKHSELPSTTEMSDPV